jgi:hypothetical protein
MSDHNSLARLRVEDPTAADALADALWEHLARNEPKMFAALWRRAHRPAPGSERLEVPVVVPVQWIEERAETPAADVPVQWVEEPAEAPVVEAPVGVPVLEAPVDQPEPAEQPISVIAQRLPAVNLAPPSVVPPSAVPPPAVSPTLMIEPSPSLAELLESDELLSSPDLAADLADAGGVL